jgi:sec-independent protein translocase protein TatB
MFNVGGGEILVIFLVALVILGPQKLPEAAKQVGAMMRELKKVSTGFQDELKAAIDFSDDSEVENAARAKGDQLIAAEKAEKAAKEAREARALENKAKKAVGSGTSDPAVSTAASAGMYNVVPTANDESSDNDLDDELANDDHVDGDDDVEFDDDGDDEGFDDELDDDDGFPAASPARLDMTELARNNGRGDDST